MPSDDMHPYEPTFTHTDDYPEIHLRLQCADARVDLSTT